MAATHDQMAELFRLVDSSLVSEKISNTMTNSFNQDQWMEIAGILNLMPGASHKTWTEWRRLYHNRKLRSNKKKSRVNSARRTGGGPACSVNQTVSGKVAINEHTPVLESNTKFDFAAHVTNWQNAIIIKCSTCNHYIYELSYDLHTLTDHHRASLKLLNNRVDFQSLQIFPTTNTMFKFVKSIKNDFTILIDHLLLKHTAVLVEFSMAVQCEEEGNMVSGTNNNIDEIQHFYLYPQTLSKFTNLRNLCSYVVLSFILQCWDLNMSFWFLESILYFKITVLEEFLVNKVTLKSPVNNGHDDKDKIDSSEKTKTLNISRCKQCNEYVYRHNYRQHFETTTEQQIPLYYRYDETIKDCILNCRFTQDINTYKTINTFFQSINSKILNLINHTISVQYNGMINVNAKICINYSRFKLGYDCFGTVKKFTTYKEMLTKNTNLSFWFQRMSSTLDELNREFLKTTLKSHYFDRIEYFDIYFYEVTNNL